MPSWKKVSGTHLAEVLFSQAPLINNPIERSTENDETMTDVTEHDGE
jgi:hypothetical protein